jgi:hypothetical protein
MQNSTDFSSSVESLEYITSIASVSLVKQQIVERFYLQSLARQILPNDRVAWCLRRIVPGRATVNIVKNTTTNRAHYQNLIRCGQLWPCPICAAAISEGRRIEISEALAKSPYHVALITYTVQHNQATKLQPMLAAMLLAYRKMKGKRSFTGLTDEYAWVGSIRSLEVTHGDNGWHPHIHELLLFKFSLDAVNEIGIKRNLKQQWIDVLQAQGYTASFERGVDVQTRDENIRDYISKFGHQPVNVHWSLEHELTKAVTKKARKGGRTPMQLLADYGAGDVAAGALWYEYASAFKRRNQLVWSRGLRKLLNMGKEKSNAELSDDTPDEVRVLAQLTVLQWRGIVRADLRGDLLQMAVTLSEDDFLKWLKQTLEKYTGA